MNPGILLMVFIVAAFTGYKVIKKVPSLLHTPLMSGMNALSGITVLGALIAASSAVELHSHILGVIAIILATINVVSGFGVTYRMLNLFTQKGDDKN